MIEPEAIGNPVEHKFANGAVYTFQELSLREQAGVVAWIRSRRMTIAREAFGSMASTEDRAAAIRIGMRPPEMEELQAELNTLETMLHVLYLSSDARRRLPPLSEDEFVDSLGNVGAPELVELLRVAQGITGDTDQEEAESGPNANANPNRTTEKGAS
jgi:hypothetical protein